MSRWTIVYTKNHSILNKIIKWFGIFPNENNRKNDLKYRPRKFFFATKKIFQSRSPKIALNSISFTFLSYWIRITLDLHLTQEDFYKKEYIKELCKKSF